MIFQIIVLIFSAIIHEYMHGWAAERMGDSTAKDAGRLTLNPLPHIDPVGSILMPVLLVLSQAGFIFGWAKPVPVNPRNFRDPKYGEAKVSLAGPMANLATALFFGILLRFIPDQYLYLESLVHIIIFINVLLMVFNLLPIPPLDGSKVIAPFLPLSWRVRLYEMERYGMILVLAVVFFGFPLIWPLINFVYMVLAGAYF